MAGEKARLLNRFYWQAPSVVYRVVLPHAPTFRKDFNVDM